MKITGKRIYFYFAAANLIFVLLFAGLVIIEQTHELRTLLARTAVLERRLAQYEENLAGIEHNRATLAELQLHQGGMIHTDDIGESLTRVQALFDRHNIVTEDFFTRELNTHEAAGHHILETKATIVGIGSLADIMAFLHSLTAQDYYYRLERVQVTDIESGSAILRLDFSVYGFGRDAKG